jgi:hypothetical protein
MGGGYLKANQVEALKNAGIKAASLNSTISQTAKAAIFRDLEFGHPSLRLLYGMSILLDLWFWCLRVCVDGWDL